MTWFTASTDSFFGKNIMMCDVPTLSPDPISLTPTTKRPTTRIRNANNIASLVFRRNLMSVQIEEEGSILTVKNDV